MPAAMGAVLFSWFVIALVLTGIGLLGWRLAGAGRLDVDRIIVAPWLGLAGVTAILQVWNLFLPVTLLTWLPILPLAFLGLATRGGQAARSVRRTFARHRGVGVLGLLLAVWLANRALAPGDAHDSGLYHYGVVEWANASPLPIGLGNLHIRLGFNNAVLLYDALLNTGPWRGRSEHIANGSLLILMMPLFLRGLAGTTSAIHRQRRPRARHVYGLLLGPPLVLVATSKEMSSFTTDWPAAAATFVLGWLLIRSFERRATRADVLAGSILAALAIVTKLSVAVFAGGAGVILFGVYAYRSRSQPGRPHVLRSLAICLLAAGLLIGPWLIRGALNTGHLLFPSPLGRLPVSWAVQETWVRAELRNVEDFAKLGEAEFAARILSRTPLRGLAATGQDEITRRRLIDGFGWIPPWAMGLLAMRPMHVVAPALVFAVGLIPLLRRGSGEAGSHRRNIWLLILPAALAVCVWLASAPSGRFIYGVAWFAAAMTVGWAARFTGFLTQRRLLLPGLMLGLVLLCLIHQVAAEAVGRRRSPFERIPFVPTGADRGFHPLPVSELTTYITRSGLVLQVPVRGYSVWRGPLPSTGFPHPDLRLRREGRLSSGFRIDGPTSATPPGPPPVQLGP